MVIFSIFFEMVTWGAFGEFIWNDPAVKAGIAITLAIIFPAFIKMCSRWKNDSK